MDRLRFTPYAWAKLIFLRDIGNTEVSFYALTDKEDISLVIDVLMVPQSCSMAYTEFKDDGIADFFDKMVDAGHEIENFGRIWCHTHPGSSASPSGRDDTTFKDAFGNNHWAIMFILGTTGETTCRLKYKTQPISPKFPGRDIVTEIPVKIRLPIAGMDCVLEMPSKEASQAIDWKKAVTPVNKEAWEKEYKENWSAITYEGNYGGNWQSKQSGNHYNYNSLGQDESERYGFYGQEPFYGPGWRLSEKGNWVKTSIQEMADRKAGITVSPDYAKWKASRVPSQPIQTTFNGKLTKREQKYLKKHGSLKGFVAPTNNGTKQVKLEKLDEQSDDGFEWMDDAIQQAKEKAEEKTKDKEISYTVTLDKTEDIPAKYRGATIKHVMAVSGLDAMNKVYKVLGLPPYSGILKTDGKEIYIPSPDDIEDDTKIEDEKAIDQQLELLEEELQKLYEQEDAGKLTIEQRAKLEDELFAKYDAKISEKIDNELGLVPLPEESLATNEGLANFAAHEREAAFENNVIGFAGGTSFIPYPYNLT